MTALTIELPWPDADLWPNRRTHFMVKARAAKQAKADGQMATLKALDGRASYPTDGPIPVRLTFHPPSNRRRDLDNMQAAMKHYLDGVALALNVNDHLFQPYSLVGELDTPRGTVIVTVGR